jgi:hypothetical protein
MEIKETYYFMSKDFDANGKKQPCGTSFREVIKGFERDFHERHPSHYALFLFANELTMQLLERSCNADEDIRYGMDLINGHFDPATNYKIENHSRYKTVYMIDSAYSEEEGLFWKGAYPLTLLIDDSLRSGVLLLKYLDDDDDEEEVVTPVDVEVDVLSV